MLDTNWQELYEDAIFEINPDKLASCIEEAEQAIAQQESFVDITEAERHRLADARSVLKSLSRIASSQGKQASYDGASPPAQQERLG
jgi:phage gp29-like protein